MLQERDKKWKSVLSVHCALEAVNMTQCMLRQVGGIVLATKSV